MKNVKRIIPSLLLIVSSFGFAQIVTIPDANFKATLLGADVTNEIAKDLSDNYFKIDANNDGEIQESEALQVSNLFIGAQGIINTQGLEFFINLDSLFMASNPIVNIDLSLNVNLVTFSCGYSLLENLDLSSNVNLVTLNCAYNAIDVLDITQNINLESIDCRQNSLTSIDISNNIALESLIIDDNQLTSLDVSNNINLVSLDFWNNEVTSIDVSNNPNLTFIRCQGTLISELDLSNNQYIEFIDISNAPNLNYVNLKNGNLVEIPGFLIYGDNSPNLEYVCVENEMFDYFVNLFSSNSGININSYCAFTPGGDYNTITGNITFDSQNNGCSSNDDVFPFINLMMDAGTGLGSTFTNISGEYSFYTLDESFTVTPNIENAAFFNVTPIDATINFPDTNNNITTQDFCISANGVHPDIEIAMASNIPARPGFDAEYLITYKNKGNQTVSGDVSFSYDDTVLDFVTSTETPTIQATGLLTWDYSNLLPFESRSVYVTLNVNGSMETPAVNIDDNFDFSVMVNPIVGDELPSDNQFDYKQIVVGSYDPNDITCIEGDMVAPSEIGNFLHYMIRFENTGNAAAENIVVKTEIDPAQFDIGTLQLLSSSHNPYVRVEGNIIEFIFEGIFLEASGTGSGGHGNILLRMKTKEDLQTNDTVSKDAEIFFDYNFPIETNDANTTFATLSNPDYELDETVSLYPNPVKDVLNIKAKNDIISVSVYDVQGRLLLTKINSTSEIEIDLSARPNGLYFVKITTDNGTNVEKVIKD